MLKEKIFKVKAHIDLLKDRLEKDYTIFWIKDKGQLKIGDFSC